MRRCLLSRVSLFVSIGRALRGFALGGFALPDHGGRMIALGARVTLAAGLGTFSIFATGCADKTLPLSSRLDRLRVLALVANQPEVAPGATVTITPHISDVYGVGRALTFTAEACIDPGVGLGAEPSCAGNPTRVPLAADQAVTAITGPNYTGAADTFTTTVPADAVIFAGRSAKEQFNGVAWLITYELKAAAGASGPSSSVKAFKRLVVSGAAKTAKNQNPVINDIFASGSSLTALPGAAVNLTADLGAGSQESYEADTGTARTTRTESITTSWYISDGDLKFERTQASGATEWTPPGGAPGARNVLVIAVTRDDRGGVAVRQKAL